MFSSDDEDFVLSQKPNKVLMDSQSFGYGQDVIDSEDEVVSLEVGKNGNFVINVKDLMEAGSSRDGASYDQHIEIEDILSDEGLDTMEVFIFNYF